MGLNTPGLMVPDVVAHALGGADNPECLDRARCALPRGSGEHPGNRPSWKPSCRASARLRHERNAPVRHAPVEILKSAYTRVTIPPRLEKRMPDTAVLTSMLGSLIVSVTVALVGHRLSRRQARTELREQSRQEAAADLCAALRDVRTIVRSSRYEPVTPADVAGSVVAWGEACERQDHRLPDSWTHVRRSVRSALGEHFGAIVLADLDPTATRCELPEVDPEWQENVEYYLNYAIDRLARWGESEFDDRTALMNFDAWLRERDWQHTLHLARFPRLVSIFGRPPATPW